MSTRNGCAVLLIFVIILCVVIAKSPTISREEYRAYKARRKIEESMDVLQEMARIEAQRNSMRQPASEGAPPNYQQPVPSLPPSVLSR